MSQTRVRCIKILFNQSNISVGNGFVSYLLEQCHNTISRVKLFHTHIV